MTPNPWTQRVKRAEQLAGMYPFASQILDFYLKIARFQGDLYQRLEAASDSCPQAQSNQASPPELKEVVASFPEFLALIEQHAPEQLARYARDIRETPDPARTELLNDFWSGTPASESAPLTDFPMRAFLQPYAEFVRRRSGLQWEHHTHSVCPFCGRKPCVGVLRQQGDGGSRSLICSFCLAEWQFRRILCPACGEENHANLPVFTANEMDYVRVECCDTCKSYVKTVDLTKNGLADPVVDEIAAIPLDLWAQERGYSKLQSNLLQM
jgi:formate dehydrogenase accessory protein FdhE